MTAVVLFNRVCGLAYIVRADVPEDYKWVRAMHPTLKFEIMAVPIGGALKVRAVSESHLDVTTTLQRGMLV